jgi:hypothetical protein
MKKIIVCMLVVIMTAFMIVGYGLAASSPPAVGGMLPDIKLSMPKDSAEKSYLGLGFFGFGSFKIPEVKASLLSLLPAGSSECESVV